MTKTIAEWLEKLHESQRECGSLVVQPATPAQIIALRKDMRSELDTELPDGYAAFLALSNGLNWNGTMFYAAESPDKEFINELLAVNQDLHSDPELGRLLVLGESGMDIYVYDPGCGEFRIIDRFTLTTYETYPSFDALLDAVLLTRLF